MIYSRRKMDFVSTRPVYDIVPRPIFHLQFVFSKREARRISISLRWKNSRLGVNRDQFFTRFLQTEREGGGGREGGRGEGREGREREIAPRSVFFLNRRSEIARSGSYNRSSLSLNYYRDRPQILLLRIILYTWTRSNAVFRSMIIRAKFYIRVR